MSSSADVDRLNSADKKSNEEKEKENPSVYDLEIKFSCAKCGLQEICHYFGRKPPFVTKQIEFTEDTFVMRDPFSPREIGRANFLQIGGNCSKCRRTVCVDCSTFYYKRYCNDCCAQYLSEFPPEIGTKIQKKLSMQ